jgi:hypothetical protein
MAKANELFSAFYNHELPVEGGFILSSFFDENSTYSRYDLISYNNVKDIYLTAEGDLTFMADGKKLCVLVEPVNYPKKHDEPSLRDSRHRIPYRYNELEIMTTKRQDRVMVGKHPIVSYTSFTVVKSEGDNFSYIIYDTDDVEEAIEHLFMKTLWRDANIPKQDAERAARYIKGVLADFVAYQIE